MNCASLSSSLIESELFGHERGSFTGADRKRRGRFELADQGTLFLDEIGELPLRLQAKLLRVLEDMEFERIGGNRTIRADVRIIAATNRDLEAEVAGGRFRSDLYYRLCADRIETPSLAALVEADPEELVRLVRLLAARLVGDEADEVAADVIAWIRRELGSDYPWPGNVRELEQCVRNIIVAAAIAPWASTGLRPWIPPPGSELRSWRATSVPMMCWIDTAPCCTTVA